jgi:hypothetical protein
VIESKSLTDHGSPVVFLKLLKDQNFALRRERNIFMDIEEIRKFGRQHGMNKSVPMQKQSDPVPEREPDPAKEPDPEEGPVPEKDPNLPVSIPPSPLAVLLRELPKWSYSRTLSGSILSFPEEKQADDVAEAVKEEIDRPNQLRVETFASKQVSNGYYVPIVRVSGAGKAYGMLVFKDDIPVAILTEANQEIRIASLLRENPPPR